MAKTEKEQTGADASAANSEQAAGDSPLVQVRVTKTGTNISGMTYLAGIKVYVTSAQATALEQAKAACRVF